MTNWVITTSINSRMEVGPSHHDSIWIVVNRLTKSAHFVPVKTTYTLDQVAEPYIREIVRLHGVPNSIVSDRDSRFTSRFWKSIQHALGMKLKFSTSFSPQAEGQSERTIQIVDEMLRACALKFQGSWDKYLPLLEFSYNIVVNQLLVWHHMKLFMGENVERLCIGTKWEKESV